VKQHLLPTGKRDQLLCNTVSCIVYASFRLYLVFCMCTYLLCCCVCYRCIKCGYILTVFISPEMVVKLHIKCKILDSQVFLSLDSTLFHLDSTFWLHSILKLILLCEMCSNVLCHCVFRFSRAKRTQMQQQR